MNPKLFFTRSATSLWIRFLRFYLLSNKRLQDDLLRIGLTPPQFYVLATLGYTGGLPFNEIGAKMMVTVSNLTGIVDRLEEKGLALRERNSRDRRVVRVLLTAEGTRLYETALPILEESLARFFSPLDRSEQKTLASLLRKLMRS
jgi:DNA-binding MarR family transcriptional regulator